MSEAYEDTIYLTKDLESFLVMMEFGGDLLDARRIKPSGETLYFLSIQNETTREDIEKGNIDGVVAVPGCTFADGGVYLYTWMYV